MIVSGGVLALTGIMLLVNLNLQFNTAFNKLEVPQAPVVHQLHDRTVEVDWNDVAGADRYQLQQWHPSGWIDLLDDDLGIEVDYYGSRAVVNKRSPGAMINTFRVKALGCGRESDWSAYGRKADAEYVAQPAEPNETIGSYDSHSEPDVIWSGLLTAGMIGSSTRDYGYSLDGQVGLLSPDAFTFERSPHRVVRALQASDGFFLELRNASGIPNEFTLAIHNAEASDVTRLSSCDSVHLPSDRGDRYLWPGADVQWVEGSHAALSISLTRHTAEVTEEHRLRPIRLLTAEFEEVPSHHDGEEFSLQVRFSKPVAVDGDSLRRTGLQVRGGVVTGVELAGERKDLWEVKIAPDTRRGVGLRLSGTLHCAAAGAICTQHHLRLVNQPEAVIPGPPITVRLEADRVFHSGSPALPVRIQLSEPLMTSSQILRRQALQVSGGSMMDLRRVEGRSDLWELIVSPQSAAAVAISLDATGLCVSDGAGCLEDLYRIAAPLELSIPPAVIHLTFDDGPHPVYTPQILDILARHDARATFFVTGESATLYPELINRIVSEGHTLANHTWDHVALDTLSAEEFEETVLRTQQALGEYATPCIRPPYYRADEETYERAARLGLRVIMGNVRPRDWALPGAMEIADRIVGGAANNAVVVLHDGGGDRSQTVEALRSALASLSPQNYSFEPVCN